MLDIEGDPDTTGSSHDPVVVVSEDSEAAKVKTMPSPYQPAKQEIEEHNITHLPHRSWCRHCVRGRGKSQAHQQLDAESSHVVPHVSFDYVFLGQEDEKALPSILIRDHSTRITYSHAVPCKGTSGSKHPARQMFCSIKQLGYSKIIFKSDNEPAILELRRAVCQILCKEHGMTVIEEGSPVEDHQANVVAESANGQFGGMASTFNDQLISNYGWTPPTKHAIYSWLINHSSFLLTPFHVGVDAKTALQRLKSKQYRKPLLMFAGHVLYLPVRTTEQKKNELAPKWEDGTFPG